jgi:DNA-binding CsgD family transcriptional regulator
MTKASQTNSTRSNANNEAAPQRSFADGAEPEDFIPLQFGERVLWATRARSIGPGPTKSTPMSGDGVAREVIGRLRVGELDYLLVSQAKESGGQACDCDLIESLSERETQIAVLISRGKATKQIACTLRISEHTVRTYLRRTFFKLQVSNRPAMVAKLMQYGQKSTLGVVAAMGVVIDECVDLGLEVAEQIIVLKQDEVLEHLMPALDLALRLP